MSPSEGLCEKTHPQESCVVPGLRLLAIMVALSTESLAAFPRSGRTDVGILLSEALVDVCGVS